MGGTLQRDEGKDTRSAPFEITVFNANNQILVEGTGTLKRPRIAAAPLH